MMYYGKPIKEVSEYDKHLNKIAGLKASHSVVGIVSNNLPVEMCENLDGFYRMTGRPAKKAYLYSSGIILECVFSNDERNYLNTILAPFCLFKDIDADKIDIDVYVFPGDLYKAELLACDFHYNLYLLTFNTDSPLPAAVLTPIDDVLSIDPDSQPHLHSCKNREKEKISTFGLRPCSNLFKVAPDMQLVSVTHSHYKPRYVCQGSGTLRLRDPVLRHHPARFSYNELYEIEDDTHSLGIDGAPILSSLGKIIGILFGTCLFLPSNVVLRWWNHYKSTGGFRRPFLGMEVANLHDSDFNILSQFTASFPRISTAAIVTKVEEDSLAFRSGIRTNDVIVKLDGKLVPSKMEFYEIVWEKVGKAVEVNIFRETDGKELNVSFVIEEASPNQFRQWPQPGWDIISGEARRKQKWGLMYNIL